MLALRSLLQAFTEKSGLIAGKQASEGILSVAIIAPQLTLLLEICGSFLQKSLELLSPSLFPSQVTSPVYKFLNS